LGLTVRLQGAQVNGGQGRRIVQGATGSARPLLFAGYAFD
jgi:hypothetical protein